MDDQDADDVPASLDGAIRVLDSLPPETVRQAILDRSGLTDTALTALADIARNSEDLAVREEARRYIDENDLGLLYFSDETGTE